jgi:hypothetical protein
MNRLTKTLNIQGGIIYVRANYKHPFEVGSDVREGMLSDARANNLQTYEKDMHSIVQPRLYFGIPIKNNTHYTTW